MKFFLKLIFPVITSLVSLLGASQNNIEFQQLKGENVSTQSITYAVAQDSIGNLWVASEEGVLKHNSKFFRIYNTYNGLPEIFGNRTTEIFIDSKQRIWIGLEKGVGVYDKALDVFKTIESTIDINPSLITTIIEDEDNHIWVAGFNGLWRLNEESQSAKIARIVSAQDIQDMAAVGKHIIYGTSKGLYVYNSYNDKLKEVDLNGKSNDISTVRLIDSEIYIGTKSGQIFVLDLTLSLKKEVLFKIPIVNPINDIVKNGEGNLYIATDGNGLYLATKDFSLIDHWTEDANNTNSLSSNGIYDLFIGNENILWIATYGGGINYFDPSRLPFKKIRHQFNNPNSIVANFTRAIAQDTRGKYWFGTKKGISIWNQSNNNWTHIPYLDANKKNVKDIVLALEPDGDNMWVGTYNNGLFMVDIHTLKRVNYNKNNADLVKKVYALFKDSRGSIWVGGIDDDLAVIDKNNHIEYYPIQQVKSIYETKDGYILTTGRFGVYKIDPKTKFFESIEGLKPELNTLSYATINNIVENNQGLLILATNGEGLVFYNPSNKQVNKLTINEGMPSDIVQSVLIASDSNLWASTTKGLVKIKLTEKDTIINVFDEKDGLASTEFNYGSYRKINDSLFAFGGTNGVTFFNPLSIKDEKAVPMLVLDEFKLFNKKLMPGEGPLAQHINQTKEIVLKHNENSVELLYTGVLYSSASKVKYAYKLEGFDEAWSKPSVSNQATYTNLPSGEYTFKVKAYNKFGNESQVRTLNLTILAPWWATNQAYAIYIILVVIIILSIIHFTSMIMKKKNADEQIDFFNNITHEIKTPLTILISSLDNITERDDTGVESKKRIKTTVKRINSLFEQMLNFQKFTTEDKLSIDVTKIDLSTHLAKRVNNFKPLTEERNLEIIVNNEWPEPEFYFDKDVLDKILLNLISNAIKYSFENGYIYINLLKTTKKELKIEIIDEGLGIPKDQQKFILKRYYRARNAINSQRPGTGLGLMMVKKLLEKTEGTIDFYSEENKGTKFTIVLKNLKFEYDKKLSLKESELKLDDHLIEDQQELDDYSDSKILIVEDNDELRDVLVKTLGVYFQVFEASNGKEGLDKAMQVFPDMILTDLIMPEMDGMQMAKTLKEDINLNHIPVFMLTVLQNSAQKLESIEAGISEYIEKPVDIKFLLAKMVNTLKWQKQLREKYVHDNEADNALLFRNKNDQEFLENLENSVIENIENESFSVHDLSSCFGMSRTSLYMKLKNLVDLSPQDFIIHTKLKYAKKLLIEGEHSIKEVAYRSGFSNPKYFSTSFKKFYKMTPSGFLDSLRQG
ncbi:hybrid sensor histidine kinase/response regulator transcription factor [Aestuariivivens insulae]|uniref:hybrid sensor histidine kinase/response regulator transcription factor n=1 Tax=Aestuariivivens insulae TaxID=1621988 RepID=UPI001F5AD154|nr:ATP-binding protein [Aestuariivivens insulae]